MFTFIFLYKFYTLSYQILKKMKTHTQYFDNWIKQLNETATDNSENDDNADNFKGTAKFQLFLTSRISQGKDEHKRKMMDNQNENNKEKVYLLVNAVEAETPDVKVKKNKDIDGNGNEEGNFVLENDETGDQN